MRKKIMRFILRKVAKVPEATIMPKWCQFIAFILFPLRGMYANFSNIKYDYCRDIYTINGLEFSSGMFHMLNHIKPGELFWFVKKEGKHITIESVSKKTNVIAEINLQ